MSNALVPIKSDEARAGEHGELIQLVSFSLDN